MEYISSATLLPATLTIVSAFFKDMSQRGLEEEILQLRVISNGSMESSCIGRIGNAFELYKIMKSIRLKS